MAKGKYAEWLEDDKLMLLEGWARDGCTDDTIAKKMGINRATLYDWKKKYSNIDNALKKGKEVIDYQVENSLLRSALGYSYIEETEEALKHSVTNEPLLDDNGDVMMIVTKRTKKYAAPNATSMIFWLKNRKVNEWRDKREVDTNINTDNGLLSALQNASGKVDLKSMDAAKDQEVIDIEEDE